MKRKITGLLILPIIIPALMGCNNQKELSLYRKSNFYYDLNNQPTPLPLATYHHKDEGNVPYVSLKEFLTIVETINNVESLREVQLDYTSNKGIYNVNYSISDKQVHTNPFIFDKNNQTITINKEAKAFYSLFYDYDPNITGMSSLYQPVEEKNKDISLSDNRVVDLKKYDLKIIEQNNDLYAPLDLYQVIFQLSSSPTGNNHIIYNGVDYFSKHGNSLVASCYSSKLCFDLQDPNILLTVLYASRPVSVETSFLFEPKVAEGDEKYRFETSTIAGGEFAVKATGEIVNIPDFFLRISLFKNGQGSFKYVGKKDNKEFTVDGIGLFDNKTISYEEDDDYLRLKVSYPNPFDSSAPVTMTPAINKNETFYLEDGRSKEYALYDFKVTSLYLGEFYGLVQSNPKVRDSVDFLKPFKEKILATDYHDYHLAMSEMALKGIDDGHTKVLGFSAFSNDDFNSQENTAILNDMTGPRRKGILQYLNVVEGYRKALNKGQGYEVVGDTAYLAFDSFGTIPGVDLSTYTKEPNKYVADDTIGFAYTAMKDVSINHPEVERVVFDLTCNSGGMVIALPFLLGLMKREFNINAYNYYVNDLCERYYTMDLNGNGVFGEQEDTYEGKYDFYVLTSNMSFSCGNAFPGAAKYNNAAKIIGKRSAGGASGVDYFTTPSGFELRCSSCMTEAFKLEDGTYIENDAGIPVDYEISEELWYNREALNAELDRLTK